MNFLACFTFQFRFQIPNSDFQIFFVADCKLSLSSNRKKISNSLLYGKKVSSLRLPTYQKFIVVIWRQILATVTLWCGVHDSFPFLFSLSQIVIFPFFNDFDFFRCGLFTNYEITLFIVVFVVCVGYCWVLFGNVV